jgi:hypothetical protein
MARKPQAKSNQVAGTSQDNTDLCKAALFKVTPNNKIQEDSLGYFLLNPSSYEESKTSNWVSHEIPGQSDPIMSWVSGGARTVNFEALITKDQATFDLVNPPDALGQFADAAVNALGNIASAFAGVNLPALGDLLGAGGQEAGENLGITNYLNYYRSLMYPALSSNKNKLLQSPPLVALFVGKSFSKQMAIGEVSLNTDLWIVKDLRIKITKQLANLCPMEATVSFQLIEYIRRSKSNADFSSNGEPEVGSEGSIIDAITGLF